jgi:hypothetical protein
MLGGGHPGRIVKIACETDKPKLMEMCYKAQSIIYGKHRSRSEIISSPTTTTQSTHQESGDSNSEENVII